MPGALGKILVVLLLALIALIALLSWPWRVDATAKALSSPSSISLAGGVDLAGFSASAAAILGGPGVVAIHLRGRELLRRPFSLDALLAGRAGGPAEPAGLAGRLRRRGGAWLLERTDLADLPELGLRVLESLREVSLRGAFTCGFRDPALTGMVASWLFPLAGILAPLGVLDVSIDWTGRRRLDGAVELSFRFVPARLLLEGVRFVRHHVHPFRRAQPAPSLPPSPTP